MKKALIGIIAATLLTNCSNNNYLGTHTNVDFRQKDKRLHAGVSAVLMPTFDAAYLLTMPEMNKDKRLLLSYASTLGVGASKELYDKYFGNTGYSYLDMEANVYGATTGLIVTPFLDRFFKYVFSKTVDGGIRKEINKEKKKLDNIEDKLEEMKKMLEDD